MAKRSTKKAAKALPPDTEYALNESDIAELATRKVFVRGEELLDAGALLGASGEEVSRGFILRASCCGSEADPYQVRALIGESGVRDTDCSCPYDYEGICKHVVALLLLQAREPDSIVVLTPLAEVLKDLSHGELVAFLTQLSVRDSEIHVALHQLRLAKLAGEDMGSPSALPDTPSLRSRARGIIHGAMQSAINAWQWEDDASELPRRLIRSLKKLLGESRMQVIVLDDAGSDLVSGSFHEAVLHEIVEAYHDSLHMLDEEGDIGDFADECAQELKRCLKSLSGKKEFASCHREWKATLENHQTVI